MFVFFAFVFSLILNLFTLDARVLPLSLHLNEVLIKLFLTGCHDVFRVKQGGEQPSEKKKKWLNKLNKCDLWRMRRVSTLSPSQDHCSWEGRSARRWGTWAGRLFELRGRNWMRGTERNWEESPQQNFCSIQALQTGSSPVLYAWLLSRCRNKALRKDRLAEAEEPLCWRKDGRFNKDLVSPKNSALYFNPTSRDDSTIR